MHALTPDAAAHNVHLELEGEDDVMSLGALSDNDDDEADGSDALESYSARPSSGLAQQNACWCVLKEPHSARAARELSPATLASSIPCPSSTSVCARNPSAPQT